MGINVQDLVERKTVENFPNIVINNPTDVIPAVISCLEKGDIQLIINHKGRKKVVSRISPSAFNIDKLTRVAGTITYNKDSNTSHSICSVNDYISCI